MRNFNDNEIKNYLWDSKILRLVSAIYKYQGKQELFLKQRLEELNRFIEIAQIQSTEVSNEIEGIVTTSTRLRELVEEKIPALEMVRKATYQKLGRFTKEDVRELCPILSVSSIELVLRKLISERDIKREGSGKSTHYIRLK
ncbi:hypothetical protein [Granulicatella elegans]|uniref:hypothetical protein n=1 Tax=Granulicatella elegans TaxID=137732 RepID=UPI001D151460|nr:hypothetical protein [Granulicatella elegans]UEA30703.1 hypothetical protein LK443_05220 [Granulicatella elegans]